MLYKYGMRLRGFSLGCQPMNGFVERQDDTTRKYHDILLYNRQLTEEELKNYELDYLGSDDIEEMAVLGCHRNPQARTAEECAKCVFNQGKCNAHRHAEYLYKRGYRAMKPILEKFANLAKQAICNNTYPYFDKDGKPQMIWNTDGYTQIDNLVEEFLENE